MSIDKALDYIRDVKATVRWTEEQREDAEFFASAEEMLEELKARREDRYVGKVGIEVLPYEA